jgi:fructose-1,6-bisphosphatase/inositol monophosphatase family enzyme
MSRHVDLVIQIVVLGAIAFGCVWLATGALDRAAYKHYCLNTDAHASASLCRN